MSGVSSIFRDMDKLSPRYVPKVLQHREDQIRFLSNLYETALENIQEKYLQVSQLVGPGALADATPTLEPSLKLVDGFLGAQN